MLNDHDKLVVYLDPDTLKYLYLSYTKQRNYPVMNKLFTLLHEGYQNNFVVTPLTLEHIQPFIEEQNVSTDFFNMMGAMGQLQFFQRFTIRTLQLIRVINHFFDQTYSKPVWRDAFSSDPNALYAPSFNQYLSNSAMNVQKAIAREKKNSQIYFFINSFREGKPLESIAPEYFAFLWDQFPDLIKPYLPMDGDPEYHFRQFLEFDGLQEIPEFHIIANILYPLFETYGIKDIELGLRDDLLLAAETVAAYMPYTHFYVTTVDVAELVIMTRINESYGVRVYDHNESSLYKLINDLGEELKRRRSQVKKRITHTAFRKPRF